MLLRVCYIDVPGFFALARRDKGQCQSLVKTAFKKSFKLRRKGHTGEHALAVVFVRVDGQA